MFKIGDAVYFNPKVVGRVDTQKGFVQSVTYEHGREMVIVYWEKDGNNDGGAWRAHWLILV